MPLVRISIRHPRWVLLIALLGIAAVAPGLTRLQLRTDGQALLPHDAPQVKYDQSIRRDFGIKDKIIILLHANDRRGIFNIHTMNLVRELTQRITGVDGLCLDDVTSLATERGDRVIPGTLNFRSFLDPPPKTAADLRRIQKDLQDIQIYTGTLVSFDQSSTCILVGVPESADRTGLYRAIKHIVADLGEIPETVKVVGAPVAESLLGTHILEDLGVPAQWIDPAATPMPEKDSHGALGFASRVNRTDQANRKAETTTHTDADGTMLLDLTRLWIARHIGLLPLSILAMILVFLITFRSVSAALLPLVEVAACLIFVFSIMGWSHTPIYLTFAVLPIILTAMGIADEIHIFVRYRQLSNEINDSRASALVDTTMSEMWRPVVKTSITTVIGFLSFSLSSLRPVQAFGLFTAIGILFCMLWSLTVIPASLVLLRESWLIPVRARESTARRLGLEKCFHRLAELITRRPIPTLLGLLALLAWTPWGLGKLFVQDSWIDGFARSSVFYQATQKVNDGFRGTHILVVEADTGGLILSGVIDSNNVDFNGVRLPAGDINNPSALVGQRLELRPLQSAPAPNHQSTAGRLPPVRPLLIQTAAIENGRLVIRTPRHSILLSSRRPDSDSIKLRYSISPHRLLNHDVVQRLCALETFIKGRSDCVVGGVLGPCSFLETINYTAHARRDSFRTIPKKSDRILWLWNQYERTRGSHRLHQIIDDYHARCLLTVFMKNANYRLTKKLINGIRDYEKKNLTKVGISLGFAGDVAVSQAMIGAIVSTQLRSLLLSIAGILIVTSLFYRSLRWGLYSVLPCALAVLSSFAIMGALGIPIGVATSMFAAMTLGIGVDFAIHFVERYRTLRFSGRNLHEATIDAITTTGPAILIDALAISLGFGILILSQVPANAYLGELVVMSVLASFIWTILLSPALIAMQSPRGIRGTLT